MSTSSKFMVYLFKSYNSYTTKKWKRKIEGGKKERKRKSKIVPKLLKVSESLSNNNASLVPFSCHFKNHPYFRFSKSGFLRKI